jgi:hypothetical protein
MVKSTRYATRVTSAPLARISSRIIGAGIVSALLLTFFIEPVRAAPVDPKPSGGATCTDNTDCGVHAGNPGSGPQPRPSGGNTGGGPTGPVEPPVQECVDPTICALPPAQGQEGEPADPARTAQEAFANLPIRGPQIGIVPRQNGSGLVGLPVWLWTTVNATTWGPYTATAAVPGLTVTAVARAAKITWNMGDGRQVTCANPGTQYKPAYGNTASPTCGYRYARASRSEPNGTFTITGTTSWVINWTGGGQAGVINQTRQAQIPIRIEELQVVTQ